MSAASEAGSGLLAVPVAEAASPGAAPAPRRTRLFGPAAPLSGRVRALSAVLSFVLPLALWSAVSYLPFLWHPLIAITDPGSIDYLETGMRMPRAVFEAEVGNARAADAAPPRGVPANPVYLPAPHEVALALWDGMVHPPTEGEAIRMPQSLWHSIQVIAFGFVISSLIGVPLGILCGASTLLARLIEPFVDFVRYMPAPAFGALMVAILGIYDGPKIAIIVIGTFFQQVLVIANTVRRADPLLVEAALTLGSRGLGLVGQVIVPAVLPRIYRDQRILLGWAWTYLIVAELIGTSSGITFFITQQARYQHFSNVYAGILVIGAVGIATDVVLGLIGRRLFPWAGDEA